MSSLYVKGLNLLLPNLWKIFSPVVLTSKFVYELGHLWKRVYIETFKIFTYSNISIISLGISFTATKILFLASH